MSRTIRTARAASLLFIADISIILLPYVRPSRTIEIVEIMLSTSFWAVPAFSRVEPVTTSGPTTTSMGCWAAADSGAPRCTTG